MDIEVLNPEIHGKPLRDIRLPLGVLVISITRNGQTILTHGYTRLRLHDIVTVLGAPEQLEQVRVKLQF
jgi:Trk K+ transport system NAD-binding subunit